MTSFVLVTATREKSNISAVIAEDEWSKLYALAEQLPVDCVWTAKAHPGAGHRSESVVDCGSDSPPTQNAKETL